MNSNSAEGLLSRIGSDMRLAMKNKKKIELSELRTLLARISNAEAVPIESGAPGVEVQRKQLTLDDIKAVIAEEENEILATIGAVGAQAEYAAELNEKLRIVQRYK